MKSAGTPFGVLRDSFTVRTLATSAHGSWGLWPMYRGHKLPMIFSYRKLPPRPCAICRKSDDCRPHAKLFRKESLTDPGHLCPHSKLALVPHIMEAASTVPALHSDYGAFLQLEPNSDPLAYHSAGGRASLLLNPLSDVMGPEEVSILPAPLDTWTVSWEQLSEH